MSARTATGLGFAASCAALLCASSARAYSDPASFNLSPIAAGGGGRYFTGSPADGYTCKVCHEGGAEPKVDVRGLPLAGYRPGTSYEVTISWPGQLDKIALALELTDIHGAAAGSLQLPEPPEIAAPELCEPASDGLLAAQLSKLANGRQIINVPDCGSKRVRFLWSAPKTDLGQVWFAGSMIASDGESDPHHDGVTDFGRVLGSPAVASETTAQCGVHGKRLGQASSCGLSLSCGVFAVWLFRLRRRQRHPAVACGRTVPPAKACPLNELA